MSGAGSLRGHYSERVRELFADTAHGGWPDEWVPEASAHAAEGGGGAEIELTAITEKGALDALRYRVFGCPHLIAACEYACERIEGRPVEALADLNAAELVATLDVPVEKTGRMLLLEDALRSLQAVLQQD